MSSFKRRTPVATIPGTRPSPYNSLPLISLGLAPLDDLLGGGVPLSSVVLLCQDHPTQYADLLLKFFVAQGLEAGQDVLVVEAGGEEGGPVAEHLMAVDRGDDSKKEVPKVNVKGDDKMKIAFRYEKMGKHQTTVEQPTPPKEGNEASTYCSLFDLSTTRMLTPADRARLHVIDVTAVPSSSEQTGDVYAQLFERIKATVTNNGYLLGQDGGPPKKALRIALSNFGSPSWGPPTSPSLFLFLHNLRHLLRSASAAALVTFPAHLYQTQPSTPTLPSPSPLLSRLSHAADAVLALQSFADSPTALAAFPRHQGLLHISKLPSLSGLVPPSAKLSVMRGLGGGGEGRENNLGFRIKRRRFVVETVVDEPAGLDDKPKPGPGPVPEPTGHAHSHGDGHGGDHGHDHDRGHGHAHVTPKLLPAVAAATGVRGEVRVEGARERVAVPKRVSASATIHSNPERYEF